MLIEKRTNGKMGWIAACLLILPAISMAQQVAIGGYPPLPTANSNPAGITAGPDGALWFAESAQAGDKVGRIGRISTAGVITEYPAPARSYGIAAGPDGALWFTELDGNNIGRITTAGVITEYLVPTAGSYTEGITAGPDGALWFTEGEGNNIGRITTGGVITEYPVPTAFSEPGGITAGPDGALWFTEYGGNNIGRITTAGVITEYPVPTGGSYPQGIAAGPDGALWFTESYGKIGRITTAGAITEYPVPTAFSYPQGIAAGPDGALWFTEYNKIGRITTAGAIMEYPVPTAPSYPTGITAGPDGELWFTDSNTIGEVFFLTANLSASPASGSYKTNLSFTGSGFAPAETVQIYYWGVGSAVLASGVVDASGSFTATAHVPVSPYGPRLFVGVGQTSGKLGAADFSISPRLFLNPTSGPVGSTVTARGTGFGSLEQVKIYWPNPKTLLGEATANVNGTFSGGAAFTFTVPSGAPSGVNTVVAKGLYTKAQAHAYFTVQ